MASCILSHSLLLGIRGGVPRAMDDWLWKAGLPGSFVEGLVEFGREGKWRAEI